MSSLYPINSHPWNTFAVNAGLLDLLTAVGFGVGTSDANMSSELNVTVTAVGVGSGDVTLGITAPINASGTGIGAGTATPSIFYYGAIPVLVTDWDTSLGVSPNKIQIINWDNT